MLTQVTGLFICQIRITGYRITGYRITGYREIIQFRDPAVRFKCPHLLSEGSGVRGGRINRYKGMRLKRDAKIEIFKLYIRTTFIVGFTKVQFVGISHIFAASPDTDLFLFFYSCSLDLSHVRETAVKMVDFFLPFQLV